MARMERPDLEDAIRERQQAWLEAWRRGDLEQLDEIVGEEFVLLGRGAPLEREAWFESLEKERVDTFEFADSDFRVYGDFVVANSLYREAQGGSPQVTYRATDCWIFRDGNWQVVTRHVSPHEGHG